MDEELSINPYYDKLSPILQTLPESPGVYQFFDKNETIIYIGKAKNLKNRVLSYFHNDAQHNSKTRLLVRKIYHIFPLFLYEIGRASCRERV